MSISPTSGATWDPMFAMFKQIHFSAQPQLSAAKTNDYINLTYRSIEDVWFVRVDYRGR